ncbi:copper homeostasis protein CutC [Xanthomonas massiliensis]|uniref:copper homeostasis protein CutC n=1 Tax=Xanthomonas massiliensis TaxID=1720302 RepID=UPI0008265B62|nr:copper homeostasis protein CutC [Xanthomonas massiliensis]
MSAARTLLEVAAGSLASALAAQAGGADRVELCDNLGEGGTTPSYGTLALTRDRLKIPLYVLIRPRAGDFLYSDAETEIMLRDIETCVQLGCDGVVIGALQADGSIDARLCHALVSAAGRLGVAFHRAFDATADLAQALEEVIALRCVRVLTSGGHADAWAGRDVLAGLVAQAGERIAVMPGAGITAVNAVALAAATGAAQLHASCKRARSSAMHHLNPTLAGLAPDWYETDEDEVRALVAALAGDRA